MTKTALAPTRVPESDAREIEPERASGRHNSLTGARALLDMLRYRRPHKSISERKFINRFLRPLGMDMDGAGNLICRVGKSRVMWSCHIDTVHRCGGKQQIALRGDSMLTLAQSERQSNCLGADDTAGVWLMREMILAGKPGLYVFHRGEELGCIGSQYIASKTPRLLEGIDIAIALDRMGETSVITHQSYGRCCSDKFGLSLAEGLGENFVLDDTGVYTDTASYVDLVPECTNISVGYYNQHNSIESLNGKYLLGLLDRLLALDTDRLKIERIPGEVEDFEYSNSFSGGKWTDYLMYNQSCRDSLAQLVRQYPDEIADILEQHGYDANSLQGEIYAVGGAIMSSRYWQ